LVPICFAVRDTDDNGRPVLYSPLDEKPKRSGDPRDLARVKDLLVLPQVTLLVHQWDEDWSHLAWLRLHGSGEILEPQVQEVAEHAEAVVLLRAKYPQYRDQAIDARPLIRMRIDRAVSWRAE
jgi:PPOX class probable F420-dependent enzyme